MNWGCRLKVKLTRLASRDLQSARDYIHQDKPGAAQAVVARVFKAIDQLIAFPMIGRAGRVPNTRELVVSGASLFIVYQIKSGILFIVRVLHTAQQWP